VESPISIAERPSTAPVNIPTPDDIDGIQRPSTGSSVSSSIHSSRSSTQRKQLHKINESDHHYRQIKQEQSSKTDSDERASTQKEFLTEQKPYYHDILVIHTQPPRVNYYIYITSFMFLLIVI
jgi:hypothetical protein